MKGSTFDGGLRVPAIERWPGTIPVSQVSSAVTASIDVFPTIIRAADTAPTVDRVIDGRDILSLLKGEIKSVPT